MDVRMRIKKRCGRAAAALAGFIILCAISRWASDEGLADDAKPPAQRQPLPGNAMPAQQQPAQPPAAASPSEAQPPAAMTVLNTHDVQGVLVCFVDRATNENMGRIVDVLVD